jgi:hypothetical protein
MSLATVFTVSRHYATADECNVHCQFEIKYSNETGTTKADNDLTAFVQIDTDTGWSGAVMGTDFTSSTKEGSGTSTIAFPCSFGGVYSVLFQKQSEGGILYVKIVKQGTIANLQVFLVVWIHCSSREVS